MIRWEYSSLFVAITGNVYAMPDQASHAIFNGSTRALFTTTTQNVSVSGTKPWDGAPGGTRASFAELDAVAAPYGDILALHPSHCFIPTISSLDLATGDPFFDVDGTPGLPALSPFEALYFPSVNQEHVAITPENAVWVKQEIEAGVTAVPLASGGGSTLRLAAGPNPARGDVTLGFTLPANEKVRLAIFGVDGRQVAAVLDGPREAGPQSVRWNGCDASGVRVPAGVYFARLQAGTKVSTARFARLR